MGRLRQLDAGGARPRLHVHSDIHEAAGVYAPPLGAGGRVTANAAVLDGGYQVVPSWSTYQPPSRRVSTTATAP